MKAKPKTPSKQLAAGHQRLVACIAICVIFAAFLVVCFSDNPNVGALALFTALVSGIAKVAIEFFKSVRG